MIDYNVVSSSSSGNCVIINHNIMIDCGLSYKVIEEYASKIELLIITHIHGDHFKKSTIQNLIKKKPKLHIICNEEIALQLKGGNKYIVTNEGIGNVFNFELKTGDKIDIQSFKLYHDVETYGFTLYITDLLDNKTKIFYATDTATLEGISAKDCDLYFLETNYCEEKIMEQSKIKQSLGQYDDTQRVIDTHLSRQEAESFFVHNKKENSEMIPLHKSNRNY